MLETFLLVVLLAACFGWANFKNQQNNINKSSEPIRPVGLKIELIVHHSYSPIAKEAVLARFKNGQVISDLAEYWDQKLGKNRFEVMNEFLQKGLIMPMPNELKLENVFSLAQLKEMCKNYNLKVSGRKNELAQRLFSTSKKAMEELASGIHLMCLTESGNELVNKYYERLAEEYLECRAHILEHLNDGNLTDAIRVSHIYKSNMLWPSGFDEDFDINFLSGVLSSPLGNKDERFEAALMHLLPKS